MSTPARKQPINRIIGEKLGLSTGKWRTASKYEGGWLLSTSPLGEVAELAVPVLKPLVELFAEQGYDWIKFDRHADEIEGLPVYAL